MEITLNLEIPESDAIALANLTKRIGFYDLKAFAKDNEETNQMVNALNALKKALSAAGYDHR
jgi:hypothetical protein